MKVGWYAGLLRDGKRRAFLFGPYDTKERADSVVEFAHNLATQMDPFCHFDTAGVFRLEHDRLPPGTLNGWLGFTP